MLRKFLAAAILAVFMLSAQIAAAADFDWNKAPRIGSKAQLARYVENERRKEHNKIRVILTNGLRITDKKDFANIALCLDVNGTYYDNSDGTMRIDYEITEYPGTRVANAYLSRQQDIAWKNLSYEEKLLYSEALPIVNEARKISSEVDRARYIHDAICNRVKEFKNENDRNKTAIGALIDGYAQCQGFADAFYMLGRMTGLNVGRIGGIANGNAHGWNWITFSDGKSYCVDVTNGFNSKGTYLFCATKERIEKTHSCEWSIIPNLQ